MLTINILSKRKAIQITEDVYLHLRGYALVHGQLSIGEAIENALNVAEENDKQQWSTQVNGYVDNALDDYIKRRRGNSLNDYSKQITDDGIIHPVDIKIRRDIIIHRLRAMLKKGRITEEELKARIGEDIEFVLVKQSYLSSGIFE